MFTAKDNLRGAITTLFAEPACISGHGAVSANNPMARYDMLMGFDPFAAPTARAAPGRPIVQPVGHNALPARRGWCAVFPDFALKWRPPRGSGKRINNLRLPAKYSRSLSLKPPGLAAKCAHSLLCDNGCPAAAPCVPVLFPFNRPQAKLLIANHP